MNIFDACRTRDLERALQCIEHKYFDCNEVNDGTTAIHIACEHKMEEVVLELLDKKDLNINAKDSDGDTPLITACLYNMEEVALKLLDMPKIDVNAKNNDGDTALLFACVNNLESVALKLFKKGVEIDDNKEMLTEYICTNKMKLIACVILNDINLEYTGPYPDQGKWLESIKYKYGKINIDI